MMQIASHSGMRVPGRLIALTAFTGALALSACTTAPHPIAEFATPTGSPHAVSSRASRAIDWPSYGYDPAGTRFSPASQITPANAHSLTLAWTYR
ncbi:MAG TPA: hypothetical protein VLI40_03005, partial [Gemmatimonadaceae bacterium]|nr:hypothetical protein [Gemmatimonadaceae bacterium]